MSRCLAERESARALLRVRYGQKPPRKRCCVCDRIRPRRQFVPSDVAADGLMPWCRACHDVRLARAQTARRYQRRDGALPPDTCRCDATCTCEGQNGATAE